MGTTAKPTRENRTITVDFHDEATYYQLLDNGKAFLECVLAFVMALGFQLTHKAACEGGGCLTRHSHYGRVRLGGLTIWRIQCTTCKPVFTVLPHFVLRYRQMRPEVARDALLATHGGLRRCVRCSIISRRWRSTVSSVRSATTVWSRCSPGVDCRSRCIAWRMKNTAAVSRTRCICRRLSVVESSGIWAILSMRVRQPLPPPMASFNAPRLSRSRLIGSEAS